MIDRLIQPDQPAQQAQSDFSAQSAQTAPRVSVIVPVYNVATYLDQALSSIETQTLEDIEIIVIDDGSTDASASIIDDHGARDGRIVAIHKHNEGYGASCNRGLARARGTWVAFVEPDDWIEPTMLETLVAFAETTAPDADVVKSSYFSVTSDDPLQKAHCRYKGRIRPNTQPFTIREANRLLRHHPSIWSALYRRAFLDENGIRFREEPGAGWVDNVFLYDTLLRARKILYVDESLYNYREETVKDGPTFAQVHPDIVLRRWLDMDEVLTALSAHDTDFPAAHDPEFLVSCDPDFPVSYDPDILVSHDAGILGAHTKRALTYLSLALGSQDYTPHDGTHPSLALESPGGTPRNDTQDVLRSETAGHEYTSEASQADHVMELAVAVADRLDPAIVFSDPDISPHQQELFALIRGLSDDEARAYKPNALRHMAALASDGVANIRANGLGDTLGKIKRLFKN